MISASACPCPICANIGSNLTLDERPNIPSLQNVALQTSAEALAFPQGAITMVRCANCSFVWNASFDPAKISYDETYNNDVTSSAYYLAHLDAMADRVIASVPEDTDIHYVEIGCGEGDFLSLVHQRAGGRMKSATGFDPSFTGEDKLPDGAKVYRNFFSPDNTDQIPAEANVVCSRHTIEHVADVQNFATALAAALAPGRTLFIETPDANWILEHTAFQDFFYEHCSIYTPDSIRFLLAQQGLECDVEPVYDGQYMWVSARMPETPVQAKPAELSGQLGLNYLENKRQMMAEWTTYFEGRRAIAPIALWGGASKGVTFSLLFNTAEDAPIDCVIDLNVAKQGCFMPISGTMIVSPETAKSRGVGTVIIMNPNYEDEIRQQIQDMGWTAEVRVLNG